MSNNAITLLIALISINFGLKSSDKTKYNSKVLFLECLLDSVKPGPITKQQLLSFKNINIKGRDSIGNTTNYKLKEFSLRLFRVNRHKSISLKFKGNELKEKQLKEFSVANPGDKLILDHFVILGKVDGNIQDKKPNTCWIIVKDLK